MSKIVTSLSACALLLSAGAPAFAWGGFSGWTAQARENSSAYCSATRLSGRRVGLAYVFVYLFQPTQETRTIAYAENVSTLGRAADLWVQASNVRSGDRVAESQRFNAPRGAVASVELSSVLPTYQARCAVQ